MYQLCEKLEKLTPYAPIEGSYPVRLDANESYFDLPACLKKEVAARVEAVAFNRYPDPYAKGACAAFAALYGIDSALVTAGNGSDELISVLLGCFLQKGERLMSFSADFSMYRFYGSLVELDSYVEEKNGALEIDVDRALETIKRENIAAVIFSNPCNPTSLELNREQVLKLISGTDALVILDEAYMDFSEGTLLQQVADFDNLVILRTCSKAMGLAAIRLGFAVACKALTSAIRAAKSPYNVSSVTQAVAEVVLTKREYLEDCRMSLIIMRQKLYQNLIHLFGEEALQQSHTNFVYVQTDKAKEIYEFLLTQGVVIRLMGDYLRITAGSETDINALVQGIKAWRAQND